MELDLIEIWKKDTASLKNAEIDVDKAIGKKSTTVLAKIKFILKIEFWLNNLVVPACSVWYFIDFGVGYGVFTFMAFLVYFFYYIFLIRSINRFDYSGDVKESLTKVYKYLRFYLLHYKVVIWVCYVLVIWGVAGYGFYMGYTGQEMDLPQNAPKFEFTKAQAYVALGLIILVPVLFATLLHWLINLIYGRKIKKLKSIIKDLDNGEG
ncbi:MAG: hypothetical protein AAGG59_09540 [Bacteroidota bacterium]